MTQEEKKVAVLIWLATDTYAQGPNNTDGDIMKRMQDRYPELLEDNSFGTTLHDILDNLISSDDVKTQERDGQIWYTATLKGKKYAQDLIDKRDVLKYVRLGGIVENKLTPVEMLDKVLYWFSMDISKVMAEQLADSRDKKDRRFITQHDGAVGVINYFIKDGYKELNSFEFTFYFPMILDKLVKDKFITYDDKSYYYSQNLEGVIFSINSGYKGVEDRNSESEYRLKISSQRNVYLFWVTICIAVSTASQGIFNGLETLKNHYKPAYPIPAMWIIPICFWGFLLYISYIILKEFQNKIGGNKPKRA